MFVTKVKTLTAVVLAFFLATGLLLIGQTPAAPVPVKDTQDRKDKAKKDEPNKVEPKKDAPKKDALSIIKKVVCAGSGNVTIRQGDKETINGQPVQAQDAPDGIFTVSDANDVDIEVKELPELVVAGSGNIDGKDVKARRAVLVISGSGHIRLSGAVDEQVITVAGSGEIHGRELKGKQATVNVTGSGNVVVNVTESVQATVVGSGSVRYLGSPKVEESITGSGSVGPDKDTAKDKDK